MALRVRLARPEAGQHLRIADSSGSAGPVRARCRWWASRIFGFLYFKYQRIVDDRLKQPIFANTAKIYAAPREVRPGQKLTVHLIANELREAGYTPATAHRRLRSWEHTAKACSRSPCSPARSRITRPTAPPFISAAAWSTRITDEHGQPLSSYELEPLLITGLSEDANRTKRRLLTYDEIPHNLVHAVIAIEDRRFFEHGGIDYVRILGAFRNDIFHLHRYEEGGSTLTQQLARGFFLTPERTYSRKIREAVISFILEHRFNKQQIFAMYANEINLGQRGSFSIDGFGEAAQAYFGKDVRQLDLSECALLAGHHPEPQPPQSLPPCRSRHRAAQPGARLDGGDRRHHQGSGRGRQG